MKRKICRYELDKEQKKIVKNNDKYILVTAGAGSGKTLTILGKIDYLINDKKYNKDEILCISFTKASSESLKQKIKDEFNLDIDVYTFHKLAFTILKQNKVKFKITSNDTLEFIIHEFFYSTVLNNKKMMKLILKYFGVRYKKKDDYINFLENEEIVLFESLIETFIRFFKCNNYSIKDFSNFKKKINIFNYKKERIFLIITLNIYLMYQNHLLINHEIDFDDMIIKATECIDIKGIKRKYKYIIIDEYQDTSYIRFKLIKNIIDKTNSKLMVVGDDFQSIYRFTGCDISLFLNFKKYFNKSKIMKINNTYRNSQELINVASSFIMKNNKQIKKKLKSNKHIKKPIKIIYYQNIRLEFIKLINKIYNETKKEILILGRNNKDICMILNNDFKLDADNLIYLKNKNIKMKYMTVHKSKGLESDNVIIINLEDKLLGFPNKIKDDKLLRFVKKDYEKYPYSEERRLFYVALTRTKNNVYLLTKRNNESIFIKELLNNYKNKIEII